MKTNIILIGVAVIILGLSACTYNVMPDPVDKINDETNPSDFVKERCKLTGDIECSNAQLKVINNKPEFKITLLNNFGSDIEIDSLSIKWDKNRSVLAIFDFTNQENSKITSLNNQTFILISTESQGNWDGLKNNKGTFKIEVTWHNVGNDLFKRTATGDLITKVLP